MVHLVEVLQTCSSRGYHYAIRFDKILEATNKSGAVRELRKPKAKSSAKIVHRLTAIEQDDIAARYQQGWSSRRLAEAYGVTRPASSFCFEKLASKFGGKISSDSQAKDIIERCVNGALLAAIGDEYGASADTIRKLLLKQGVTLRRPWEHPTSPTFRSHREQAGSEHVPVS